MNGVMNNFHRKKEEERNVCVPLPIPWPSADRMKAPSAEKLPDCCTFYSNAGHSPRNTSSCQTSLSLLDRGNQASETACSSSFQLKQPF